MIFELNVWIKWLKNVKLRTIKMYKKFKSASSAYLNLEYLNLKKMMYLTEFCQLIQIYSVVELL